MALTKLNSFIDRLLENVPEEKKAAVRAEYSAAQDEARAFETEAARIRGIGTQQLEWWNTHKDAVTERDQLRTQLATRSTEPVSGLNESEIQKRIDAMRDETMGTGLGLLTAGMNIGIGHLKEFGEQIDMGKLTQDAINAGKKLVDHYNELVAPRRQERAATELATKLADAEARGKAAGVQETLNRVGQGMPFPTGSHPEPTTLSGLRPVDQRPATSLDAAVATANAVMAEQQARQ